MFWTARQTYQNICYVIFDLFYIVIFFYSFHVILTSGNSCFRTTLDNLDSDIEARSEAFSSNYDMRLSKVAEQREFFKTELQKSEEVLKKERQKLDEKRKSSAAARGFLSRLQNPAYWFVEC